MTRMNEVVAQLTESREEVERLKVRQEDMGRYIAKLEQSISELRSERSTRQGQNIPAEASSSSIPSSSHMPTLSSEGTQWIPDLDRSSGYSSTQTPFNVMTYTRDAQTTTTTIQDPSQEWNFDWATLIGQTRFQDVGSVAGPSIRYDNIGSNNPVIIQGEGGSTSTSRYHSADGPRRLGEESNEDGSQNA